jgi:hypothetical protein
LQPVLVVRGANKLAAIRTTTRRPPRRRMTKRRKRKPDLLRKKLTVKPRRKPNVRKTPLMPKPKRKQQLLNLRRSEKRLPSEPRRRKDWMILLRRLQLKKLGNSEKLKREPRKPLKKLLKLRKRGKLRRLLD